MAFISDIFSQILTTANTRSRVRKKKIELRNKKKKQNLEVGHGMAVVFGNYSLKVNVRVSS